MAKADQDEYDLAVIGSGGAAFAAAIRATTLGKRVVMIERGIIGGTCVNTGCVPSKALIAAAEARHGALDDSRFPGISTNAGQVDMPALAAGKDDLVRAMRAGKYLDLAAEYGWRLLRGDATFTGSATSPGLQITTPDGSVRAVRAEHYLIATGSAPWAPPVEGLDSVGHLTSTTAMELQQVPDSLLVIGGGYVALEQAQLFARLGSRVTMLVRSRLASHEEPEASEALLEIFADEGIRVIQHATPLAARRDDPSGDILVEAASTDGTINELRASQLLVATGRRPVTDGLGLKAIGVDTGDLGEVLVNSQLQTTNPRVWAAGDVSGHREFVYVAASHGTLTVDNAFSGVNRQVDYSHLPRVIFTSPALAAVGMTQKQAAETGTRCEYRVLQLEHLSRAIVNRDIRGLIKMVADADTGRILGITALAKNAGEIAAAGVYILAAGMTVDQVANLWSPYLTMAEGLKLTAQSFTRDVARLSCCAA